MARTNTGNRRNFKSSNTPRKQYFIKGELRPIKKNFEDRRDENISKIANDVSTATVWYNRIKYAVWLVFDEACKQGTKTDLFKQYYASCALKNSVELYRNYRALEYNHMIDIVCSILLNTGVSHQWDQNLLKRMYCDVFYKIVRNEYEYSRDYIHYLWNHTSTICSSWIKPDDALAFWTIGKQLFNKEKLYIPTAKDVDKPKRDSPIGFVEYMQHYYETIEYEDITPEELFERRYCINVVDGESDLEDGCCDCNCSQCNVE